jgi:hypothetical protein
MGTANLAGLGSSLHPTLPRSSARPVRPLLRKGPEIRRSLPLLPFT